MKFAPGAWRYALPPLLAAPFALFYSVLASVASLALGGAILGFFRDPDRTPPPTGIVSPADGKISVLREEGEQVRLGVFMNVWNVHVARAPFDGIVESVEHTPGANRPAFSKDSDRNERVHVRFRPRTKRDDGITDDRVGDVEVAGPSDSDDGNPDELDATSRLDATDVRDDDHAVHDVRDDENADDENADDDRADDRAEGASDDREVTFVAGAFARRIHPYVEPGDEIDRGERLGHIAFGSRIDVVFPPAVSIDDVVVEPGERVTAGETVILESAERVDAIDPRTADTFEPDLPEA